MVTAGYGAPQTNTPLKSTSDTVRHAFVSAARSVSAPMSKPNHHVAQHYAHRSHGHPHAAHHRKVSSSSGTQNAQSTPKTQNAEHIPDERDLDQYIPGAFPFAGPPSVAGLTKISPEHEAAFVHRGFDKQENMPTSERPSGSGVGIGSMPGSNRESGVATLPEERVGGKPYGQGHTGFEPSLVPPNRQKKRQTPGTAPESTSRGETANLNTVPESQRPMTEPLFPKIQDLPISMDAPAMDFLSHMNPVHYHAPQGVYGTGEDARRAEYLHEINPVHPDTLHPGDRMRDDSIPESSIFSATQRKGLQAAADQNTTQRRQSMSDVAKTAWVNVEGVVENAVNTAEKAWETVNEYMHGHLPPPIGVNADAAAPPTEGPLGGSVSGPQDRGPDPSNIRSPSVPLERTEESIGRKKPPLRQSTSSIKDSFMTTAKDIPQSIPTHGETQELAQKFRDLKVASHPDDLPATVKEEYFKSILSRPPPKSPSPARSPVGASAQRQRQSQGSVAGPNVQLAPPPPQHSGRRRHEVEFDLDGERFDASQWLYDSDVSDASAIGDDLSSLGLDWKSDRAREGWGGSSDTPARAQQTHAKHILEGRGGGLKGGGVRRVPVPAAAAEGQLDSKEDPVAQKQLRQSGLRKAYVSSESVDVETSEPADDDLKVESGKGVGTGFGGVSYHHGYTHLPASKDQPATTILPGYPTPEGMKTLIQGRMDDNAARKRTAAGARDIDAAPNASSMTTTPPEAMSTTASGLSTLAPVKARAGIPQSSPQETVGQDEENGTFVGHSHAQPRRVPVEEKAERPVFLTGEDVAAGRFEAIFEPATDNIMDTTPEFIDPRSKAAGAAEGKFDARELPKQPTFASTISDPNVEQLVPVGDLSMAPTSMPVPKGSLPLSDNGPATRTLPERQDSRDSNAAERGSFSDLDLGLDTPTGTPVAYPLPTSSVREQSRIPVFRSGASTASGPFEARFETVTGQPKEVDERPVFKTGSAAAEGKYEATMTPTGFPPPPRKSNLKRPSGSERPAATAAAAGPNSPPLPPRPHKASVVDASMLPDDDEMLAASAGGDIGLQPNLLAHRSPKEVHEVPIFRSGDDTAAGHYEAAFATVSGQSKEVDVEPVFVGSSQGQDSAEGHHEAKMEPEAFHKRRASVSDNKAGLAYLGKPVAPIQETPQRAPRRSIN